ncbi:substrate-binding periplasmic protein [Pseudoduganella sp. OTU4001]|uniref:substrate-binding periplasmic protein n=1 Tax=Pseudoduganella sp. OTU4001 TaxID=3043854 RepID=UPI00313ADEA3
MPALHRFACVLLCAAMLAAASARGGTIYYPTPEAFENGKSDYAFELLQLALAKAGSAHRAEMAPVYRQQNRAIAELLANSGQIHVVGTMTSAEREEQMLPVRIPISKGLIGWRILLLREDKQDWLRDVRSVRELKGIRMALGQDWPDLAVLRAAGLAPDTVPSYSRLFGMLKAHRIDAVPRSINEIWSELAQHPGLVADPYLVLHYPAADYFFVNRANPELAEDIRRGLEAALADGSFDRLLLAYYRPMLDKAALGKRRVIELPNPELPPATPLARKELWLTLDQLRR